MAGNLFPVLPHGTLAKKVQNFPDDLYAFNEGDNLTTLMLILLGNSGTGQLNNLQTVARLGQQIIDYTNLDSILGTILTVQRTSPEIYSFATNPFIDQLLNTQWQEIRHKDASYRERLIGAAEAFQLGANAWGILTLCEALTQMKFYVVESWKTPGYGRKTINTAEEIVLIPLIDDKGNFTWDQGKAKTILSSIQKIVPSNFVVSFGSPISTLTNIPLSNVAASGVQSYFFLQPTITASQITPPANQLPGSQTRYWIKNNNNSVAPYFSYLQTQEIVIDQTGNINQVTVSDNSNYPSNSVANISLSVTSTMYGAQ